MDTKDLLTRTADIAAMVPYWDKVTCLVEGLDAVRAATTDFLPKFPEEKQDDYNFRLSYSKYTNVYRDVLEGLATKPFEEEVSLIGGESIPAEAYDFIEDVDGCGNNLTMFSALTFFNGINYAIDWIFVDYPTVDPSVVISREQAKKQNLKPFWTHVLAKNILEVRTDNIGSKEVINYIRIFEPAVNKTPDRVRIFNRSDEGIVTWKLFEKTKKEEFVLIEEGTLSIDTIPLVPFITGRRDGRSFKFFPPMRDACDLQITLYQEESGLEYIKTMSAYPMLAANGMRPQKGPDGKTIEKVGIGPMRVLYGLPGDSGQNGEWKFIEPNANSMEFLKKDVDKTKQDLRELGRQPLTALSTQLTTVTTAIAAGKARSAVSAWALGLKDCLKNALIITMKYMNLSYKPEVNVYTGFDNVLDDGTDLEALDKARARGDLSLETFLAEFKRRKVLSPEFRFEEESKRILNEIPSEDWQITAISDNNNINKLRANT